MYYIVYCIFLSLFLDTAESLTNGRHPSYQFMPPLKFQLLILEKNSKDSFFYLGSKDANRVNLDAKHSKSVISHTA